MLRRLAGLTSGTTADAQTATPRIFGRRRAAEAKPPPESARARAARPGRRRPGARRRPPRTPRRARRRRRRRAERAPPGSPPPRPRRRRSPTWRASSGASARPRTPPPRAGAPRPNRRGPPGDARRTSRGCEDLGFGAEAAAAYGAKFAEHGLDGWVAAEVDDWDNAEVGLSRDHATVLCCVARGAGRAAAGAPAAGRAPASPTPARGRRRRPRGRRDGRGRRLRPAGGAGLQGVPRGGLDVAPRRRAERDSRSRRGEGERHPARARASVSRGGRARSGGRRTRATR